MEMLAHIRLNLEMPEKVAKLTQSCVNMGSNIISPAYGLGMKSPLKNIQSILQALSEDMKAEDKEREMVTQ